MLHLSPAVSRGQTRSTIELLAGGVQAEHLVSREHHWPFQFLPPVRCSEEAATPGARVTHASRQHTGDRRRGFRISDPDCTSLLIPLHQSQPNPAWASPQIVPHRSAPMATLTMQPIAPTPAPATQEDQRKEENPAAEGTDLSDIDSGWVVLKNSDIVSADLAAAAVSGSQRLGTIPSWARWVIGGVVYTVVPFYNRVRQIEEETVVFVENSVEVVEHIAEATEKLAANVAKQLPEDGSLKKAVEEVEHIAEVVDVDAEKVEAVTEKIDKVSDEIDAAVEPVIEELEKELDEGTTSDNGVNTQK